MLSEISDIRKIRKKLGLTQDDLAKRAGVTQGMIAKIESGNLEPSYKNAIKLFSALDNESLKEELKASELMQDKIIWANPEDKIKTVISKMKANGFSQLPVIKNNSVEGMITESDILESLIKEKAFKVSEIMESPPPIVSEDASSSAVIHLLKYYPLVIVSKKGKISGIITKTDIISKIHDK
jgi:predicted transcriptional regulator